MAQNIFLWKCFYSTCSRGLRPSIRNRFEQHGYGALLDLHLLQIRQILGRELPYSSSCNAVTSLRWRRRKLLWQFPPARYSDPLFLIRSVSDRRLHLARKLLRTAEGRFLLLTLPFRPFLYKKLVSSLRN
jgi:hypothetical protein